MRLQALAAAIGLMASLAGVAAASESEPVPVKAPFIVADARTGDVIEHFDALRPWYPASTTKLMTIYVAFRAIAAGELSLDSPVVYSDTAAAQPPSKMGFPAGTLLTLDNALKIMMVKSANDVAVAVAETIAGDVDGFAARMNAEALRLGMTRSHFVNPHGLPDERQVTTARDMALLARALLRDFPEFRDYLRIHAIKVGKKVLRNYNTLLERYPGATGMKTGFICASGYNLVASAERDGREVIAVVFGEQGGKMRAEHAAILLDEGLAVHRPLAGPPLTLTSVSSGEAYAEPLDMRPYVCGPKRAAAASEANQDGAKGAGAPVSRLTDPVFLGPPIRVSLGVPRVEAADGSSVTLVARMPRPRPILPTDGPGEGVADAFAPVDPGAGLSAPAQAIDSAAGLPAALPASPAN